MVKRGVDKVKMDVGSVKMDVDNVKIRCKIVDAQRDWWNKWERGCLMYVRSRRLIAMGDPRLGMPQEELVKNIWGDQRRGHRENPENSPIE